MRRAGQILWATAAILTTMITTAPEPAMSEEKTPSLRYIEEYTSTRDVRDLALFADKIWAATEGGIAVYDRTDGHFLFKLTSRRGLFGNSVRVLAPTARGTLLAGGDYGIAEISADCAAPSKKCFVKVVPFSAKVFDPVVGIVEGPQPLRLGHQSGLRAATKKPARRLAMSTAMWQAAARGTGGILLGGMDGRLVMQNGETETPVLTLDKPVVDIVSLNGDFLVLEGASLGVVHGGRIRPVRLGAATPAVAAISKTLSGALAGGTKGEIFSVKNGELTELGRADARITALLEDGDSIWLGIEHRGLARFSRKGRALLPVTGPTGEICSNHITHVTRFGKRLAAGSFDNGACALTDDGWQMLEGMEGQYVHGTAFDGRLLWIATSNGIARFDENMNPVPLTENDPKEVNWFAASAVTALTETEDGVALGSPWGVVQVTRAKDGYTARFVSRFRGAPEHITALSGAPGGFLAASETDGIHFVGKKRKETRIYQDPVHLPEAWILDVSQAETGFWAAACQQGISYSDGERGRFIDTSKGLADNRTVGIAAYGTGAFVATLGGLSYADRAGFARSPFKGPLPDPRGASAEVIRNTLYLGTESGTAVFEIVP